MVTFTTFNNRLPDPTFGVNDSGVVDAAGVKGPGFASVRMSSSEDNQVSRTRSGRGVHRSDASQYWNISIKYNPLTRAEFDVLEAFLEARKARRYPFFVVLPQYAKPRDVTFASFVAATPMRAGISTAAGSNTLIIDANATVISGTPKMGDFFTITDATDINHLKAYKVTRVETPAYYQAGTTAPAANTMRIYINPPLQKLTTIGATINWINPQFRVCMKGDILENEIDTEGVYDFGLELEEIMA